MKIQCNVCEVAEATVLCCADEAALCWACDQKVHAANKLASKHQRVHLSTSASQLPKCDICQDTAGFFFCLEDRALLCRKCDVSIHTANSFVSAHQRFLLTGVKVGPEPTDHGASSSSMKYPTGEKISETTEKSNSVCRRDTPMKLASTCNDVLPIHVDGVGDVEPPKVPFTGGSGSPAGGISQWQLDDFLGLAEHDHSYGYMDNGSSKADSGKRGDSEVEFDEDECLGQVPDSFWAVPQVPSRPTASGLCWAKHVDNRQREGSLFVPDIYGSDALSRQHSTMGKRQRHF